MTNLVSKLFNYPRTEFPLKEIGMERWQGKRIHTSTTSLISK